MLIAAMIHWSINMFVRHRELYTHARRVEVQLYRHPMLTKKVLLPPRGSTITFSAPWDWYASVLGMAIEPIVSSPTSGKADTVTLGKASSP